MRRVLLTTIFISTCVSHGCIKSEPPKQKPGIEIHAPGVDITIDKERGVDVQAPGTDVHVDKEKGLEVKAPGVEVEARPQKSRADSEPE